MDDLVVLGGRRYDCKRNLIKKFKTKYDYEYIVFDRSNIVECLKLEDLWCQIKRCDIAESLSNEGRAIKTMIDNFELFELLGGGIKIKEKICAFALGQRLNNDTIVIDVLKAQPDISGLYQAMNNGFLSKYQNDFKFVNLEQDLGLEGLRKAKLSYHPVRIIKKIKIRLK